MKTTFEIISYFSDIRHMSVLRIVIVIAGEVKVHFLGEEVFQKEIHYFLVFLLLEILVDEHVHTPTHDQLSSTFLMLINTANWSVAGVSQRP